MTMIISIIRTDKWNLNPSTEDKIYLQATVNEYRAFCKALSYVILGHWVRLQNVDSKCVAIEKLIHQTKKNPTPKQKYFVKRFWKFPSYLRRAAIEFTWGQVSSYLTKGKNPSGKSRMPITLSALWDREAGYVREAS
ncbi:MAG: hypothetical protein ACRC06_11435 [Waterburya sp.]